MLLHHVLSYALQHSWLASLATCAAMHSSTCGAKVLLLAQKESNYIILTFDAHLVFAKKDPWLYKMELNNYQESFQE